MRLAMLQPCDGASCRASRISRSSVPCSRSGLALIIPRTLIPCYSTIASPIDCRMSRYQVAQGLCQRVQVLSVSLPVGTADRGRPRTTAIAGRVLWRARVAVHVGPDRANDVQRLSGVPVPGSLPEYDPSGRLRGVRL